MVMCVSNIKSVMATSRCPLVSPEDSFWSHVRFKPTPVFNKALSNTVQKQAHGEIAVSVQVVWFQEHMMISDGDHPRRIKKAALRLSPVRSLETESCPVQGACGEKSRTRPFFCRTAE